MNEGVINGEVCNRNGCTGIIEEHETDGGCSCHIKPPCSYCTTSREYCPECGWDGREEQIESESKKKTYPAREFKAKTLPDLDRSKINYIYKSHTHFSMIKEGVFPIGTSRDDVRKVVNGTFGGRFTRFDENNGEFEFIAYTD